MCYAVGMALPTTWQSFSIKDVQSKLSVSSALGLSSFEAQKRLTHFGKNLLAVEKRHTAWSIFLAQCTNGFVIILCVGAILSALVGHGHEAVAIVIIVLFAVLFGFFQEMRADASLAALRELTAPKARVLRNGREELIASEDVVPGDVLVLQAGDRIAADARLLKAVNVRCEEAALTGESSSVEKDEDWQGGTMAPVAEQKNMVFLGTTLVSGNGTALVVATGMQTQFGKIAGLLQGVKKETPPLRKHIDSISRVLTGVAAVSAGIFLAIGVWQGQPALEIFLFCVAVCVAVVPEALPAVVTISLAIGVERMARRKALVRELSAVETLGCTTFICTDKTGTLTKNEMTVTKLLFGSDHVLTVSGSGYTPKGAFIQNDVEQKDVTALTPLFRAAALCNDAQLFERDRSWSIVGDPTEAALIVVATKAGFGAAPFRDQATRRAEVPFTSEAQRMVVWCDTDQGAFLFQKGAIEVVLASCSTYLSAHGVAPLTADIRAAILQQAHDFAAGALRVIAVAQKESDTQGDTVNGSTFLGLFGMIDPPREEAKSALATCTQAGIRVMMLTGDHPVTAAAIAYQLGLAHDADEIVTGAELMALPEADMLQRLARIRVCARVLPEHKLRIVDALQSLGHVVAMTGDGINDAPALKKAHVGIAMGLTGTDVAREASAVVLTDDNFSSIVAAIEEGRIMFGNITKYLMYVLSTNIGDLGLIFVTALFGLPLPLTAIQILYLNLATSGLPALALAIDPAQSDVMAQRPRALREGVLSGAHVRLMMIGGLWSAGVAFGLFAFVLQRSDVVHATTVAFIVLVVMHFFKAYLFRSTTRPFWRDMLKNRWLALAIAGELCLLVLVVYTPALQIFFEVVSLSSAQWLLVVCAAATIVPVVECAKHLRFFHREKAMQ